MRVAKTDPTGIVVTNESTDFEIIPNPIDLNAKVPNYMPIESEIDH